MAALQAMMLGSDACEISSSNDRAFQRKTLLDLKLSSTVWALLKRYRGNHEFFDILTAIHILNEEWT